MEGFYRQDRRARKLLAKEMNCSGQDILFCRGKECQGFSWIVCLFVCLSFNYTDDLTSADQEISV